MPTESHPPDALRDDRNPYDPRPPRPGWESGGGRSLLFASLVVAFHAFLTFFLLGGTVVVGPRCEKVVRDFNLKLSDFTEFALAVAHWLNNYWYVLVLFLLPCFVVDGVILFLLHRSRRSRGWSYFWAFAVLLLILLVGGCLGNALYAPYSKITEGLSR